MLESVYRYPLAYFTGLIGVCVVIGAVIVDANTPSPLSPSVPVATSWSDNPGSVYHDTRIVASVSTSAIGTPQTVALDTIIPIDNTQSHITSPAVPQQSLDVLLQSLTTKHTGHALPTSTAIDYQNTWEYIPPTLTVGASSSRARTAVQDALFAYGNQIGEVIQLFESSHTNSIAVLTDAINDRTDSAKEARVEALGRDISAMGDAISRVVHVPATAQSTHMTLLQAYQTTGAALVKSAQAQKQLDTDYVASMQAYNKTADALTRAFIQMSTLLSINSVTFGPNDAGSVFMFTSAGGGLNAGL